MTTKPTDHQLEKAIRRIVNANPTDPFTYGRIITRLKNGILTPEELLDPKKAPNTL